MKLRKVSQPPYVSALAVGTSEVNQDQLGKIFQGCGWKLTCACTRSEAQTFLQNNPVGVVIAERDLPDGSWRAMLEDLSQQADPPRLVVTARLADDALWAEVLNMGGYDVLAQPLDAEEVTRVMGAAVRHFR